MRPVTVLGFALWACALAACSGYVDPEEEKKRYAFVDPSVGDVRSLGDARLTLPCGLPTSLEHRCFAVADSFCQQSGLSASRIRRNRVAATPAIPLIAYWNLIEPYYETESLSFICELEPTSRKWWLDERYRSDGE